MNKRTQYSAEYKAGIVIRVLREEETVGEIASEEGLNPVMIGRWKAEFLERAKRVFDRAPTQAEKELAEEKERRAMLERKVGQLTIENDWLKKNLRKLPCDTRKGLVEKDEGGCMSVRRQTEALGVPRGSLYPRPCKGVSEEELELRRLIDRHHTDEPTWGYRMITSHLRDRHALMVNRKRVRRLMREMGIYAIYPKPNLSKRYHAQYVRPYLLRNLAITRPDQVWGVDKPYIPLGHSFVYLFVILDWYSRYVVDYELSTTLDKGFVLACLKRALRRRRPEIINSDQGSHFTNSEYLNLLEEAGVRVSMDGKGQCLDNVRTERFFRTLKYDRVYGSEYETPREIRHMLRSYIPHYNTVRPHSSVGNVPPARLYEREEARSA